jgi:hypothetical protein
MFNVSKGIDNTRMGAYPGINLYEICIEMWYMDAYPGVGASLGHYRNNICTQCH